MSQGGTQPLPIPLPISRGGTGGVTQSAALTALGAFGKIKYTVYSTSNTSTFTPDANMLYWEAEVLGAGGGGGGTTGNSTGAGVGGGGGAGSYARVFGTRAQITTSLQITVGSKGTGGAAGANPGTTGNTSSIIDNNGAGTTLVSCPGGTGGSGNTASGTVASYAQGGDGGGAVTVNTVTAIATCSGDYGTPGTSQVISSNTQHSGGRGGNSIYGSGGADRLANTSYTGNNATGHGSGGGGGASFGTASSFAGGNGADGMIIIKEYIAST